MSVSPSAQLPRNARTPAVAGPASAERRRRASRELLAAGALAVPGLEAGHPATGVHDALLAGVEGRAGRAAPDVDHAVLLRAPRGELVAAAAGHLGLDVLGVDSRLHVAGPLICGRRVPWGGVGWNRRRLCQRACTPAGPPGRA